MGDFWQYGVAYAQLLGKNQSPYYPTRITIFIPPESYTMKRLLIILGTLCISTAIFGQTPPSPLLQSFEQYQTLKKETPFHPEWQLLGPVTNSGRVEAVQAHPSRPGTMYAAFGSGNP